MYFARRIREDLGTSMLVAMPLGEHNICEPVLRTCPVEIQGRMLSFDLIIFCMLEFEVIL